jgi:hypothetical protein
MTVEPVVVKPDTDSNQASTALRPISSSSSQKGMAATIVRLTQLATVNTKPSRTETP